MADLRTPDILINMSEQHGDLSIGYILDKDETKQEIIDMDIYLLDVMDDEKMSVGILKALLEVVSKERWTNAANRKPYTIYRKNILSFPAGEFSRYVNVYLLMPSGEIDFRTQSLKNSKIFKKLLLLEDQVKLLNQVIEHQQETMEHTIQLLKKINASLSYDQQAEVKNLLMELQKTPQLPKPQSATSMA